MSWGSSILTLAEIPMELWEVVLYFCFWWTTKATQLKIGMKSPGGSLLELTAFTAVIWMFTISWFLDNKTMNVSRRQWVSHSTNNLRQIWSSCPGIFYTLKLWHDVQISRFLDEIKEGLSQSLWRPADKSTPPRPLLLNWPYLILCTVQFNYLSEIETFHAASCGLPSLRCSLFDLLGFELECIMRMNPILYGHLQRKLIGSYHGPCDPGIFLSRCKVQE